MLTRNSKMRATMPGLYTFEIGAGPKQCPGAGECASVCYAKDGHYQQPVVKDAHARNFAATKRADFATKMTQEIWRLRPRVVRIHSSGDFYSASYLLKWMTVMEMCPAVRFYCYTKMIPLFESVDEWPENFTYVYSYGGRWDHMIDEGVDRHSKVFKSDADLKAAGYTDTHESDAPAMDPTIRRIGLVYHGRFKKNLPTLGV